MNIYQQRSLEGASGVELTVALYDGIIRFMRQACAALDRADEIARRSAVKRAMNILIHLQATLRMDVAGGLSETLSEFYAATFALMLQGSTEHSKLHFEKAIANVWEVREAWRQVAHDPSLLSQTDTEPHYMELTNEIQPHSNLRLTAPEDQMSSSWTA